MLGAVCHPEFFNHTDVEVLSPPLSKLTDKNYRRLLFMSVMRLSNYTTVNSRKHTCRNYTMEGHQSRRECFWTAPERTTFAMSGTVGTGMIYSLRLYTIY